MLTPPCYHVEACRSSPRRAPTCVAGPAVARRCSPQLALGCLPDRAAPIQSPTGLASPRHACNAMSCRATPCPIPPCLPIRARPGLSAPGLAAPGLPGLGRPCQAAPGHASQSAADLAKPRPATPDLPCRARPSRAEPCRACQSVPNSLHHAISNRPKPKPADCFESGRPSPIPTCSPTRVIRLAMSSAVSIPAS